MTSDLPPLEVARRDLEAINTLLKTPAFTDYWMRKLRERREEVDKKFREDPPEKCSKTQREAHRQVVAFADALLKMPEMHAATHRATLERSAGKQT